MDEVKLQQFMGKLVTDMGGAAMIANVIVGEELGLYRAMADSVPITPEALAAKTGCNPRLIREWLSAHAAAGYMEHIDGQSLLPRLRRNSFLPQHLNLCHLNGQPGRQLQMDRLDYYLLRFRKIGPFKQLSLPLLRGHSLMKEDSPRFHDHVPRTVDDYKFLTRKKYSTHQPRFSIPRPRI